MGIEHILIYNLLIFSNLNVFFNTFKLNLLDLYKKKNR